MEKVSIDPREYVVFDVETNGLKSKKDDLLSISFYKPDDKKEYSKFLPLELNRKIVTTHINGITDKDLIGATTLSQDEFDYIVDEFELEKRTILIYAGGNFDKVFLSEYMKRHQIFGFDKLRFYNFKRNIISSKYSYGNITKDNLCSIFNIEGVKQVHNSLNDCKLEWKLFERMGGYYYLVTEGNGGDNVFRLNEDYIIPASLLSSHPNLGRILSERPYIECQSNVIKSFEIDAKGIEKFPTNFTGMTIEHLINSMLEVDKQNSLPFLEENKRKLDFIGKIDNGILALPMVFNLDGTVTALRKKDKEMEERLNSTTKKLKEQIGPLVDYIQNDIFNKERILSQELVVDSKNNILALCDLSTEKAILEIKTNPTDSLAYKEQFFYEAKGRDIYHLKMEWVKNRDTNLLKKVIFHISYVDAHIGTPGSSNWVEGKREEKRLQKIGEIQKYLSSSDLTLVSFTNISSPIKLQCKNCEHEWTVRYSTLMKKIPDCPKSIVHRSREKNPFISEQDRKKLRADNYYEKILRKSNHTIVAINYTGSKDDVDAICVNCGYKWTTRADHLVDRCWCPKCKKEKTSASI